MGTPADPLLCIRQLFHFTPSQNIAGIREKGGIFSTFQLREAGCTFVPGGNTWSLEQDQSFGMDKFVHLCWALRHPMEWHIKQRDASIDLIYLFIDRAILYETGVRFSPGVANAVGMQTYSVHEAVDGGMIDYDAFYGNIGSLRDPEPQARRQRAEKSEILVPDYVDIKFITNLPNG